MTPYVELEMSRPLALKQHFAELVIAERRFTSQPLDLAYSYSFCLLECLHNDGIHRATYGIKSQLHDTKTAALAQCVLGLALAFNNLFRFLPHLSKLLQVFGGS